MQQKNGKNVILWFIFIFFIQLLFSPISSCANLCLIWDHDIWNYVGFPPAYIYFWGAAVQGRCSVESVQDFNFELLTKPIMQLQSGNLNFLLYNWKKKLTNFYLCKIRIMRSLRRLCIICVSLMMWKCHFFYIFLNSNNLFYFEF